MKTNPLNHVLDQFKKAEPQPKPKAKRKTRKKKVKA